MFFFLSYSFGIEPINTFILLHSLSFLENHTRSQTKLGKSRTVFRPKRRKNPTLWGGTYLYGLYKGVAPGLFLKTPPLTPPSKRLESRREAEPPLSPLEVLFVCLLYNRSQLTRKRSKAVGCGKQQMHKKIRILEKLTYLSAKRGFFCPFFSISLHRQYRKRISHTETTDLFVPATSWK